ncbi:MAG: (2Fe-2S)-binding protein [Candidatus Poribacteria bacterium]|nr:(2Fe-2S)-binding protein [Candidatus Poribacteria bacterium]
MQQIPVSFAVRIEGRNHGRCEEVIAGDIRDAIHSGAVDVNALKARTRTGMGLCQGRMCERIVAEMIARETGKQVDTVGTFTARPIIKPVRLDEIAKLPGAKHET